jgi:hypothetical protein
MKKAVLAFLGIAYFLCVLHQPIHAQSPNDKVILYSDDFAGSKVELSTGKYDYMYLVRAGMMAVKSVKVPKGLKVTLYERDNFDGGSLTLTENTKKSQIEAKGFGKLSMNVSVVVEKLAAEAIPAAGGFVTIYKDDFSGTSKELVAGKYDFHDLGEVDNDQLSSIKVPNGFKVTLFEHGGFQGRSIAVTSDTRAAFLVSKNFNDLTSSIIVEQAIVKPAVAQQQSPVVTPSSPVVTTAAATTVVATAETAIIEPTEPVIYQGDFSGPSKTLKPGRYAADQLGIANDELSSIKVPKGFRVTLYEGEAFEGRSMVLTSDARAAFFVDNNFNNLTSSVWVEALPMVTVFEGDYNGVSARLLPGRYQGHDFGIGNDQLSSVRIQRGLQVTLYEDEQFGGRKIVLTQDSGMDALSNQGFNNETSSIVVEVFEKVLPAVTLFRDDLSGVSKKLTPGKYDAGQLGIGGDVLSSIQIPRGLQATLYEHDGFQGRTMILRGDARMNFFTANDFNDITSSIVIEEVFTKEPMVTVYTDAFDGGVQSFKPGRYALKDLEYGADAISSARVPMGMRLILYEEDGFKGYSLTSEKDIDLSISKAFDNRTSSLVVEDVFVPQVTPLPTPPVITPAVVTPAVVSPAVTPAVAPGTTSPATSTLPPCEMTSSQFDNARKAIESKGFRDEMMTTAKLATKDRCLTVDQVRSIANLFMDDDQRLEFAKYAYDRCADKREYYLLEDVFKFMSTREQFTKFLQTK